MSKAIKKKKKNIYIYFEIKKAFRYYIKQIDFMLSCVWFSNRSQKTSKCGKNISDTLGYASCATFLFLPHFDVICDLLLNRSTATWNLFVKWYLRNNLQGNYCPATANGAKHLSQSNSFQSQRGQQFDRNGDNKWSSGHSVWRRHNSLFSFFWEELTDS